MTETFERFKNRKAALVWLKIQGIKVSQGKFYQDCSDGDPQVHSDGTVSRWQVSEYARRITSDTTQESSVASANRRNELEIRRLELDIAKKELDIRREDNRWLLKEEAWGQIAALVGALQDSLRHHFHSMATHLVHLASGEHHRAPEVYEGCEEIMAKAFNELAKVGQVDMLFEEDKKE